MNNKGFCDLGFAKLDTDRRSRTGFPEVIYCPGKDRLHLLKICRAMLKEKEDLILSRLDKQTFAYLRRSIPRLQYNAPARMAYLCTKKSSAPKGMALVISAGTSDIPIAEEAALTLEIMGDNVVKLYDVGVAGVHRIMSHLDLLRKARVIIVAAGMEGALAGLVGGLVRCPVIAVPTSCGYGAHFQGLASLLTMLNSCAPGVVTVNIDNGFGAGYFASLINK